MRRGSGLLGLLVTFFFVADAQAQILVFPLVSRGVLIYPRPRLLVSSTTYLFPTTRVTIYTPPAQIRLAPRDDDLAGVDLDVVKPQNQQRRVPEQVPSPPEPALPGVDVSVPRPRVLPGEQPAKPEPAPRPPPPQPREEPRDETTRLLDLGRAAFAHQEYGLAALRFQQAAAAKPREPLPHFLLAEALFALGKYRDAVAAIHAGMALKPGWPQTLFRPRRELYQNNEAERDVQLGRLEAAVTDLPNSDPLLFLLGYVLWFDGRRAEALPILRRARDLTADPTYLDQFLKAPAADPVAAR
jgi:hypothetical protein